MYEGDEEKFKRQREHAEMYKNFCKHLLEELNEEYLRNEGETELNRGTLTENTCGSWKRNLFEMGNEIRKIYKKMNDYLLSYDDEFLGTGFVPS